MVIWQTNGNYLYKPSEWQKLGEEWTHQRTIGDEINIGCRMINGTTYEKVTGILVKPISKNGQREGRIRPGKLDYHKLIIDALSMVQDNVSLALSCMQAQLWLQATAALIIREGSEDISPAEV